MGAESTGLEGVIADYIEVQIAQGALSPETSEMLATIGRVRNPILFDRYTKALDIMMRRVGPSLGFQIDCHRVVKVAEYSVSDGKAVRCYTIARGAGFTMSSVFELEPDGGKRRRQMRVFPSRITTQSGRAMYRLTFIPHPKLS